MKILITARSHTWLDSATETWQEDWHNRCQFSKLTILTVKRKAATWRSRGVTHTPNGGCFLPRADLLCKHTKTMRRRNTRSPQLPVIAKASSMLLSGNLRHAKSAHASVTLVSAEESVSIAIPVDLKKVYVNLLKDYTLVFTNTWRWGLYSNSVFIWGHFHFLNSSSWMRRMAPHYIHTVGEAIAEQCCACSPFIFLIWCSKSVIETC